MNSPKMEKAVQAWSQFCGTPSDHPLVLFLSKASRHHQYSPRSVVMNQGENSASLCLIMSGVLRAVKYSANGHEIWLSDLSAGHLVGELGCLTGTPRTSTVLAATDAETLEVSSGDFQTALGEHSALGQVLASQLSHRLSATSEQLAELMSLPVPLRLHHELARIGQSNAHDSELVMVDPQISVSDLAKRIHTSRETASRALSALERRGIVRRTSEHLEVVVPDFV